MTEFRALDNRSFSTNWSKYRNKDFCAPDYQASCKKKAKVNWYLIRGIFLVQGVYQGTPISRKRATVYSTKRFLIGYLKERQPIRGRFFGQCTDARHPCPLAPPTIWWWRTLMVWLTRTRILQPYCKPCYLGMFALKCKACNMAITEGYISALNAQWHPQCFVCRVRISPFFFINCL